MKYSIILILIIKLNLLAIFNNDSELKEYNNFIKDKQFIININK